MDSQEKLFTEKKKSLRTLFLVEMMTGSRERSLLKKENNQNKCNILFLRIGSPSKIKS